MAKIEPKLATGFRDYLPDEARTREKILGKVKEQFELAGFAPLETPGLEKEEILTGGDPNFKKQLFRAGLPGMTEKLALRFDLTVPLARVVAAYASEIQKPFKRYQIGQVWRGERPQAGRFREFMQCDADIVGASGVLADAEIVNLIYRVMKALGFRNFLIRLNDRKLLNGLASYAGFSEKKMSQVLRAIDKMDKLGWGEVKKELADKGGADLGKNSIEAIKRFLEIEKDNKAATLAEIKKLFAGSDEAQKGADELLEIMKALKALGVPDKFWTLDLSVARGLDYYTGAVFETVLPEELPLGSVMSGGRYDGLIGRFGNVSIPATGVSVGLDRLFAAMKSLNMAGEEASAGVMVLNFDETATETCLTLLSDIRDTGVPAEIYLGAEKTLKGQLAYALKRNCPIAVIVGGEEMQKKTAQVKDLRRRDQKAVPLAEVPACIQILLQK
jgi:histidyl-tRNA synthetase